MKKILAAVLAFATSLPVLAAPPGAADGAALYKQHCAICHGADGNGGTATPPIAGKQASAVAKVVQAHPPPMQKSELTADQTAAVGRYVSALKK